MDPNIYYFLAGVLILIGQLLLCFQVKHIWIRLIPAILFFAAAVVFFILMFVLEGWDIVGCLVLMILSAAALGVCALGWGIWAVVAIIRKRKKKQ